MAEPTPESAREPAHEQPATEPPTTTAGDAPRGVQRKGRGRRAWEIGAFLELAALCGFVIAQPVLDATGRSPDFFLFYRATGLDIAALILIVALGPPVALWALGALVGLAGPRARRGAHVAAVGVLLVLLAIVVAKPFVGGRGVTLAVAAVVVGAAAAWLYVKAPALGQFLRFAAVGPVVFAALFVFASPAGALLRPAPEPTTAPAAAADQTAVAGGETTHPPVVVLLFDELPLVAMLDEHGAIDENLFPNLAALAGDAHWFRNAASVSGFTPTAAPAMLSGVYPSEEVAPHYVQYPDNLFSLLGGQGYDVNAHESVTLLCPPQHCPEAHEVADRGLPAVLEGSAGLLGQVVSPQEATADPTHMYEEPTEAEARRVELGAEFRFDQLHVNQPSRYQDFIERLEPSSQPTVHFLHLLLPHAPWRYLPSGMQYTFPDSFIGEGPASGRSEWWMRMSRQRLQYQLAYTDQLVGGVLQALKDRGMYDDAAIMVTADHGVSLRADTPARILPGKPDDDPAVIASAAELLWVPLLVKEPGQHEGVVDDRNVQQVDVLPTLADLAGAEVPWETDGISALGTPRTGHEKKFWDDVDRVRTVDGRAGLELVRQGIQGAERPRPDLVGREVDSFTVEQDTTTAQVYGLDWFQDVEPATGTVPAMVTGTVPGSAAPGDLAIAVNGRIGAVATLSDAEVGRRWFAGVVVDDQLFTSGANQLDVLRVTGDGRLQRLDLEGVPATS